MPPLRRGFCLETLVARTVTYSVISLPRQQPRLDARSADTLALERVNVEDRQREPGQQIGVLRRDPNISVFEVADGTRILVYVPFPPDVKPPWLQGGNVPAGP